MPAAAKRELLERFFEGIERYTPDLVSWNGGGFDLPVLHYRCLLHGGACGALLGNRRRGQFASATATTCRASTGGTST